MLTQSEGGIRYSRVPLLNTYVNKCKEHSLAGCVFHTHREIFVPNTSSCVSLGGGLCCRWRACFFNNLQEALNNPSECCRFVFPVHVDELCNSMSVGRLYRVIGFPAHVHVQPQSISWSVEANSVQALVPECNAALHKSHPPPMCIFKNIN